MAVYREDELVAVLVVIRMFVAPLPVFRLFVSLQLGEFPMCFVPSLLPGLVGTAFVVVPAMAILMVGVVVSTARATVILIPIPIPIPIPGCPRAQSGSHPAGTSPRMMIKSLHVFLLERPSLILARFWTR